MNLVDTFVTVLLVAGPVLAQGGQPKVQSPNSAQYINVRDEPFRAAADGKTNDTAAVRNAVKAANEGKTCAMFPPGVYRVEPGTTISVNGAACVLAYGATIQDARFTIEGTNFSWLGGTLTQAEDKTNDPMFLVTGADLSFSDIVVTYPNRFTSFHVRGAQRVKFHNITTNQGGQSGFTINGSTDIQGDNITMNGSGSLVDDGIAIIAGGAQPTVNVAFTNVTGSHIYDILKIGTNIVSSVRNVTFRTLNGYQVKFAVFLEAFGNSKPGAQVENVIADGINMFDSNGTLQDGVLHFLPSNGSIWRNIQITNVNVTGRFAADGLSHLIRIISDGVSTIVDGLYLNHWNIRDSCEGNATCANGGKPAQLFLYYQSNASGGGNASISNVSVADTYVNGTGSGAVLTTAPIRNFDLVRNRWVNTSTTFPTAPVIRLTGDVNYLDNQVQVIGSQAEITASGNVLRR